MKTHVIQLDLHDDVVSIRDKMSWAKADRILLVFPPRGRLRLRNLDLRLLRRHASSLGAELAFVTRSEGMRRLSREEGIPSYRVAARAQRKKWAELPSPAAPARQSPPPNLWQMRREVYAERGGWQNLPAVRISFFTLAVLTVFILLLLFLPSAAIQLAPQTRLQKLAIPAMAGPEVAGVNLAGSLPARSLSIFVERSQTAPVTTLKTMPDQPASGTVRFRNLTDADVRIPAGLVVRTNTNPSIRFATMQEATVPAAAGKTADIPVKALAGGKSGNLEADALVAIEGDLGASLAVTNPRPTSGGTDRSLRAPSSADRARLRKDLQEQILAGCHDSFQESAGPGALLFPDTLKLSQVVSETYIPAENQPGDTLSLTLNVQCQVQYAAAGDMLSLAQMSMDVSLPAGFEPVPGGGIASVADTPRTGTDGLTHWTLQAQRLLRARVDPAGAAQLAQGRRPERAATRLAAALPLEATPQVKMMPSWWPWLPLFPFRISVSIGSQ